MPRTRAISQVLSVLIIFAIVATAFAGYGLGYLTQPQPITSTVATPSFVTRVITSTMTTTQFLTQTISGVPIIITQTLVSTSTFTVKTTESITSTQKTTSTETASPSSYWSEVTYAANLSGYFPNGYYSQNVSIANLKDGDNITLGDVTFQFHLLPNHYVTTEGNQTYTVTADYICPSVFVAHFASGNSLELFFCPAPWLYSYPKGSEWTISNGTLPIVAVSIQSCLECQVEIVVGK